MTLTQAERTYAELDAMYSVTVRNPLNDKVFSIARYRTKWGFHAYRISENGKVVRKYRELKFDREKMIDWLVTLEIAQ